MLLGTGLVCKVADFGLSRKLSGNGNGNGNGDGDNCEYYRSDRGMMPVRWTAPEGLNEGLFTSASDVWSFGITGCEIFMDGEAPYPGVKSLPKLIELVVEGGIHPRPKGCDAATYAVLQTCWGMQPSQRPTFTALRDSFCALEKTIAAGPGSADAVAFLQDTDAGGPARPTRATALAYGINRPAAAAALHVYEYTAAPRPPTPPMLDARVPKQSLPGYPALALPSAAPGAAATCSMHGDGSQGIGRPSSAGFYSTVAPATCAGNVTAGGGGRRVSAAGFYSSMSRSSGLRTLAPEPGRAADSDAAHRQEYVDFEGSAASGGSQALSAAVPMPRGECGANAVLGGDEYACRWPPTTATEAARSADFCAQRSLNSAAQPWQPDPPGGEPHPRVGTEARAASNGYGAARGAELTGQLSLRRHPLTIRVVALENPCT